MSSARLRGLAAHCLVAVVVTTWCHRSEAQLALGDTAAQNLVAALNAAPLVQPAVASGPAPAEPPVALLAPVPAPAPALPPPPPGLQDFRSAQAVFRLTGPNLLPFDVTKQRTFTNTLRALFTQLSFVSVALTDVKTGKLADGTPYADLSTRIVLTLDAQSVAQTYAVVGQLSGWVPAFTKSLADAGLPVTIQMLSLDGVTDARAVLPQSVVLVDANLSLAAPSGGLLPFGSTREGALLAPMRGLLGNRTVLAAVKALTTTATPEQDQVQALVRLATDAAVVPQLWFFLLDDSALQRALAGLAPNASAHLNSYHIIPVDLSQFVMQQPPAPAPAPSSQLALPPAPGPAVAQVASPGVALTGPSVTINLSTRLLGANIVPFTPEKQFAAASALAGVFAIVVGAGSTQIISFRPAIGNLNDTTVATSAGRRSLQQSGLVTGMDVVFAAMLPAAAQGSLLLLQTSTDVVRSQFASWFALQLSAREMPVDVQIRNVTVAAVTTGSAAGGSSGSSSGGSDTAAIVGGVVGGLAALALLAGVAAFVWAKRRQPAAVRMTPASAASPAAVKGAKPTGTPGSSSFGDSAMNPTSPYQILSVPNGGKQHLLADDFAASPGGSTALRSQYSPGRSPLDSTATGASELRGLLERRRAAALSSLSDAASQEATTGMAVLGALHSGDVWQERYTVERRLPLPVAGAGYALAAHTSDGTKVILRFVPDLERFQHERTFYENRTALEPAAVDEAVPALLDAWLPGQRQEGGQEGGHVPACLALERPDLTLPDWLAGRSPVPIRQADRVRVVYDIIKAVDFLHRRHIVHRNLTLASFAWYERQQRWKLTSIASWARAGEAVPLEYDLRYAAPELAAADMAGGNTAQATPALDLWALGAIAFQVLTGRPLLGNEWRDEEVLAMLLGYSALPWEEEAGLLGSVLAGEATALVAGLLRRLPASRTPARLALQAPLFQSDPTLLTGLNSQFTDISATTSSHISSFFT